MIIERATPQDLDAIVVIEDACFPRPVGVGGSPRGVGVGGSPRGSSRAWFEAELARDVSRLVVARRRCGRQPTGIDRVIGFINYWLVAGELHVLAVATHPDERRRGIAGALVAHALAEARGAGCTLATLEVRRGNLAAIALYERAGFRTVHVRQRYYEDNHEDALVMLSELAP
jgi:ribosomal-protein-alanine acetyltransferase